MTGTPFCLLPTFSLQGIEIGQGEIGEVTALLLRQWSNNVGLDIRDQIESYGDEVSSLLNSNSPSPYQFKK